MSEPSLRWDKPFELEGFWWMTRDDGRREARKSHGTLRFEPHTGFELVTFDLFEDWNAPERLPVLHGETMGGNPCTLLAAVIGSYQLSLPTGHSRAVIRAHEFVRGAHVGASSELASREFSAQTHGLREWLTEPVEVALSGGRLHLDLEELERSEPYESTMELSATARFELETETPLQEFMTGWLVPLLDFLVFATRESNVVQRLSAESYLDRRDTSQEKAPGDRSVALDIVRTPSVLVAQRDQHAYERILLPPSALANGVEAMLQRWWELHRELGDIASYFFGAVAAQRRNVKTQMLDFLSFAEAYHRVKHAHPPLAPTVHRELRDRMLGTLEDTEQRERYRRSLDYANHQTQHERISELFKRAQEMVPDRDLDADAMPRRLVDTRNYFTHWSRRSRHVLELRDLFWAVRKLTFVLQVNLLLDLGVPPSEVKSMMLQSYAGQRI